MLIINIGAISTDSDPLVRVTGIIWNKKFNNGI